MVDVFSSANRLGSLAKQCRFAVRILPSGTNNLISQLGYGQFLQDLTMLVEATELPGRGFDHVETRYYGPSVIFPRNSKYGGGIDMSILCRSESFERQLFDDWLEVINPTNIFDFNYAKDYYAEIQIFQLAEYGDQVGNELKPRAVYKWSLYQAWPMLVDPQPVTWADTDILRLKVSFAYRYWNRPERDVTPSGSSLSFSTQ